MFRPSIGLLLSLGIASAQAFEVATIRPAAPFAPREDMTPAMTVDGTLVGFRGVPLGNLVRMANRSNNHQLSGPGWMNGIKFDIQARLPDGALYPEIPEMLNALLVERFGLKVHHEIQDRPVYALIVDKRGANLQPAVAVPADDNRGLLPGAGRFSQEAKAFVYSGGEMGTIRSTSNPDGGTHWDMGATTMSGLARFLRNYVDRPIVDMTQLEGTFHVVIDISADDIRSRQGPLPWLSSDRGPAGPGVFASLERLGLKLEKRTAPIDIVVVDHLSEVPTEN